MRGQAEEAKKDPTEALRWLCRNDLFFLLRYGLNRPDCDNEWVFARCREVQGAPDGRLDLWAREHYKSTVITFAKSIQDILIDPEITIGIFSHTRPIAKAFLRQIKGELERNETLKSWFPDVLWANPVKDSPKWSEDEGIVVRRSTNPKEATVEAWGVVDGQPTSKHFGVLNYDDVVTRESVSTPDMMAKTTDALALSYNLGAHGGVKRFVGTRYHFNDSYRTLMDRGTVTPRIYPATMDGSVDGKPVFLTREQLAEKRRDMGPYVFGCQMLQNPKADETQGFKEEWLQFLPGQIVDHKLNKVILIDPASAKKPSSDYTAGWVLGLGEDRNVYVLDAVRDRLSLTERANLLFRWHRAWRPMATGYERYGKDADIEHFQDRMSRENYRFEITTLGGAMAKNDRIRRLIPWFEKSRIIMPARLIKKNYEGVEVDLIATFKDEEYLAFPVAPHDDMLDALARLIDENLPAAFPEPIETSNDNYDEDRQHGRSSVTGY